MAGIMLEAGDGASERGHAARQSRPRQGRGCRAERDASRRRRESHRTTVRNLAPSILALAGHLGSPTAFGVAVAAWGAILALVLGWFEVVRW